MQRITILLCFCSFWLIAHQTKHRDVTDWVADLRTGSISLKDFLQAMKLNGTTNGATYLNMGNRIVFKYPPKSERQKRKNKESLGGSCFSNRDCGIEYGQVCRQNRCECKSRYIQHNSTHCLPGVLLGFSCLTHSQCTLRVSDSTCVQGFCRCADGKVPYRRANCLSVAALEKPCRIHSQCALGTPGSFCKWVVKNVLGKCQCKLGMPRRGNICGPPGLELGAQCGKTYDCAQHIPGSICVGSEDGTQYSFKPPIGSRFKSKIKFDKAGKYQKIERKEKTDLSLGGICQCPEGYLAVKNGSKCVPLKKEIGVNPVSLGKPCLFTSQCKASDPYSHCSEGVCNCLSEREKCSAKNTGCPKETFQCVSDGRCVSAEFVCDGKRQCHDGSDELECQQGLCSPFAFRCKDGSCISRGRVCDGQVDCPDRSDEDICEANEGGCPKTTFRCKNGQCLPGFEFCNAIPSCKDKSDEDEKACVGGLFPVPLCPFRCKNGRCRSTAVICSGTDGCGDLSDEENCSICNCHKP